MTSSADKATLTIRISLDLERRLREHCGTDSNDRTPRGRSMSAFAAKAIEEKLQRALAADAAAGTYSEADA